MSMPILKKKEFLMNMIDKAFLLSHSRYYEKNLIFIINTFLLNDYPFNYIFNTVN